MPPRSSSVSELRSCTGKLNDDPTNMRSWVQASVQIATLLSKDQTFNSATEKAVLDCMKSIIQHGPTAMRAAASRSTSGLKKVEIAPILGAIEVIISCVRLHSSASTWNIAWPDAFQSIVQTVRDVAVLLPKNTDHYDYFGATICKALHEVYVEKSAVLPLLEHAMDLHIVFLKINLASVSRQLAENACEKVIFDLQWMKGMSYLIGDASFQNPSNKEWHRVVPFLIRSLQLSCRIITTVPIMDSLNINNIFFAGIITPLSALSMFGSSWVWMLRCARWTTKMIAFQYEMKRHSDANVRKGTSERFFFPLSSDYHLKICTISFQYMLQSRPDIGKRKFLTDLNFIVWLVSFLLL